MTTLNKLHINKKTNMCLETLWFGQTFSQENTKNKFLSTGNVYKADETWKIHCKYYFKKYKNILSKFWKIKKNITVILEKGTMLAIFLYASFTLL